MNLKVIALTGPKGSGKDTVGALIKQYFNTAPVFKTHTIAFADPIKTVVRDLFVFETMQEYDDFKRTTVEFCLPKQVTRDMQQYRVEGRHLVRGIGMLMRKYDEKQFTNYVIGEIRYQPNDVWVVTDLRFDNEYLAMKNLGAKIINIKRPNYEYDGHITERGFNDNLVDYQVLNDGDLAYLKTRVNSVMDNIMKEWA